MKRFLIPIAAAIALLAQPAVAADLKTAPIYTKAPIAAPGFSWSGLYLGGFVDYAADFASTNIANVGGPTVITLSNVPHGPGFGGVIETLWELNSSPWVIGLSGTASWQNLRGSANVAGEILSNNTNFLGDANVVLGIALGPDHRLLAAAEGGLGFGQVNPSFTLTNTTVANSLTNTSFGWNVGARLQYAVTDYVSIYIKGQYFDLGSKQLSIGTPPILTSTAPFNTFVQQFGVVWKVF